MFFHLLYIHLFRPFLKYNPTTSPLPSHVSPRKLCTQAAGSISKLMRIYKRTYGLRQICNIAVYIAHSACTIHLLNLPEKTAKRDIIHGVKHLEEIGEDWLCARRTLSILSVLARKWKITMPEEAAAVFSRTDAKYGTFSTADVPSPKQELIVATPPSTNASPPRIPASLPAVPMQMQHQARVQNQLQQSLYSYQPDPLSMNMNSGPQSMARSNHQILASPQRNSYGLGSMIINNEPLISPVPYPRQYNSTAAFVQRNNINTGSTDLSRNNSGVSSEASGTLTRQVSPNTMFGGVDALVESQDWWLRDQASLAMGFDNWGMGMGLSNGEMSNTSPDAAAGFYVPRNENGGMNQNGRSNDGIVYEDDWSAY